MFLFIIIGTTSKGAATGFAGIPIGLALVLIHLITIPVTNTSVNPARSTAAAVFAGGESIGQLWLFWIVPLLGAIVTGFLARVFYEPSDALDTIIVEKHTMSPYKPAHLYTNDASITRWADIIRENTV